MKTPTLLLPLLALAAALSSPAAAADDAPRRCTALWLSNASNAVSRGTTLPASDKSMMSVDVPGAAPLLVVNLDSPAFPCDAPLKRYLAVKDKTGDVTQYKFNDPGLDMAWHGSFAQQVKILSAVDEMYSFVDARGLAAVKAADAVVDAAVTMGVAAKANAAGVDGLKDLTGTAYAKVPVYTVAAAAADAPAAKPEDLKAALSLLLKDKASGKTSTLALGPAVLSYRKAVIELANELATRAKQRDLLAKAGVAADAKFDFVPGANVPAFTPLAPVKGTNGSPAIPDAVAEKDESYQGALKYLTDVSIKDGADAAAHETAALSSLDYGLRNLIASRAAAVDAAVTAAKAKLGTATVKATLASVDRAAVQPLPDAKPTDLAAGVVAKLQQNADFQNLNKIFENADHHTGDPNDPQFVKDSQWAKTPEGIAARQRRDTMLADAQATSAADGKLGYSVNGVKNATPINVPALKDAEYRGFMEDDVLLAILQGNPIDAKWKAVYDAFTGKPVVDATLPGGAKTIVAAPVQTEPESAWKKILAATPDPHWYHGNADS